VRVLSLNANPTPNWAHPRQVELHQDEGSTVVLYHLSLVKGSGVHGAHSVSDITTVAAAAAGSSTTTELAPHVSFVAVCQEKTQLKDELLGKESGCCGSDG
jgi:hypothetical protein